MTVRGAVIAGGRATRMSGAPKGLLEVGGRRILDRIVEAFVAALGSSPLLVANHPDAPTWRSDLAVTPDLIPNAGTLGGLYTAVMAAAPVVCVAWDMPFVPPELIRILAGALDAADVAIPESGGPRGVEPLCAGYGPGCADPIRTAIEGGDLRAISFLERVRVARIPAASLESLGGADKLFFNVNRPDDLKRASELAGDAGFR